MKTYKPIAVTCERESDHRYEIRCGELLVAIIKKDRRQTIPAKWDIFWDVNPQELVTDDVFSTPELAFDYFMENWVLN